MAMSSRTYSTEAAISGKKLSCLANVDFRAQSAISHFRRNRLFSPGFWPAEPLKSAEMAGNCQGRTLKRKSSIRYCRLSHILFCRSKQHLRNALPADLGDLRAGVDRGFARLRRRPDLILGFFRHAGLDVNQLW